MTESETWKDIAGFEGFYKVSDKGNIYSVERRDSRGHRCGGRILASGHNSRSGYPQVGLRKNGVLKIKYIHRLVAETFLPNPNDLPQVNHRDEDKTNNNVKNLEWCTGEYNLNYGTRTERLSKKVRAVNVKTGEVLTFNSTKEAGRKGYDQSGVAKASRGIYYGGNLYRNHRWSYELEEENVSK